MIRVTEFRGMSAAFAAGYTPYVCCKSSIWPLDGACQASHLLARQFPDGRTGLYAACYEIPCDLQHIFRCPECKREYKAGEMRTKGET